MEIMEKERNNECICQDKNFFREAIKEMFLPSRAIIIIILVIMAGYYYFQKYSSISLFIFFIFLLIIGWIISPLFTTKLSIMSTCKKHRYIPISIAIITVIIGIAAIIYLLSLIF